jgi:hypothetical protein
MGKKWRTNKNSNRKHKRTKTKRMRGGLGINPFARKVKNVDIVRYLIKTKKQVIIHIMEGRGTIIRGYAKIDGIFDKLEKDMTGELHYIYKDFPEKKLGFIIDNNDTIRVNEEDSNFKGREIEIPEVREEMFKTEMFKTEKEEEEKKAITPKIINVNLLDTRIPQKGIIRSTPIDWNSKYIKYKKDNSKESIAVSKNEDNNWNFDFFLRCIALNTDELPILKQIIEGDLKTSPLTYTDDTSSEITFTNPGLIYMAIPGKPDTYKGGIIYDIDGKISNHIQLNTPLQDTAADTEVLKPSVIMEEYLQQLFPQFKPEEPIVAPESETSGEAALTEGEGEETVVTEGDTAVEPAVTAEGDTVEPGEKDKKLASDRESVEEEKPPSDSEVKTGKEGEITEEKPASETAISSKVQEESPIKKSTPIKKIISSKKLIPTKQVDNTPVEVEEIELEIENENTEPKNVNATNKPKEQPKTQIDNKICENINEVLKNILLEFI